MGLIDKSLASSPKRPQFRTCLSWRPAGRRSRDRTLRTLLQREEQKAPETRRRRVLLIPFLFFSAEPLAGVVAFLAISEATWDAHVQQDEPQKGSGQPKRLIRKQTPPPKGPLFPVYDAEARGEGEEPPASDSPVLRQLRVCFYSWSFYVSVLRPKAPKNLPLAAPFP